MFRPRRACFFTFPTPYWNRLTQFGRGTLPGGHPLCGRVASVCFFFPPGGALSASSQDGRFVQLSVLVEVFFTQVKWDNVFAMRQKGCDTNIRGPFSLTTKFAR